MGCKSAVVSRLVVVAVAAAAGLVPSQIFEEVNHVLFIAAVLAPAHSRHSEILGD